ncbi:hypothetical protein [Flavobacterium sp. H122]|uniref:hypothetical protein n=1 Tax=Flavobacterium sp. H122 TaxID=2529860 RepID=UPI0010AA9EAD|nr:hypothetical protein [Flavobacterium sp. H122]
MKLSHLSIILLSLLILFSCGKEKTKFITKNKTNEKASILNAFKEFTSSDKQTNLYILVSKDSSDFVRISAFEASEHNKYLLSGEKSFILASKYKKENNNFKLIKQDTLQYGEYVYIDVDPESFEEKKIRQDNYFLFTFSESFQGQAVIEKSIHFLALNTNDLRLTELPYNGTSSIRCEECIDGEFSESKSLNSNPAIKKELYKKASKHKWIYHPTEEEKNPKNYKNYSKYWEKINNADNNLANGYSPLPEEIYSTYYKEDIFKFTGDYEEIIENDTYKIVSYFRGNLLGYDKTKKLYFPIYIESCITGCNKKISFLSEHTIEVEFSEASADDNAKSVINLTDIIFKN